MTTPCHFSGVRWWFICPLSRNDVPCGRRVGKLYCSPGNMYYGCRHCHNLSYESRNDSRHGRLAHMGYFMTLERRRKKILEGMARWTYRGRPTRKARRLHALEVQMATYGKAHLPDLM